MKHILLFSLFILAMQARAQQTLRFTIEFAEETATEKIYDFIVDDFDHLVAWQLAMHFDSSGMRFKEIRNSVVPSLTNEHFYEPEPGLLLSSWLGDLMPADYPNPVTAFQIAFELFEPGGSELCFSTDPFDYEIVLSDGTSDFELDQLVITDECVTNFVLVLNTTAVVDADASQDLIVNQIHLTTDGLLSFTTVEEQLLEINLIDITGRHITSIARNSYVSGRHSVETGKKLMEGVYFVEVKSKEGDYRSVGVFAH